MPTTWNKETGKQEEKHDMTNKPVEPLQPLQGDALDEANEKSQKEIEKEWDTVDKLAAQEGSPLDDEGREFNTGEEIGLRESGDTDEGDSGEEIGHDEKIQKISKGKRSTYIYFVRDENLNLYTALAEFQNFKVAEEFAGERGIEIEPVLDSEVPKTLFKITTNYKRSRVGKKQAKKTVKRRKIGTSNLSLRQTQNAIIKGARKMSKLPSKKRR